LNLFDICCRVAENLAADHVRILKQKLRKNPSDICCPVAENAAADHVRILKQKLRLNPSDFCCRVAEDSARELGDSVREKSGRESREILVNCLDNVLYVSLKNIVLCDWRRNLVGARQQKKRLLIIYLAAL
jgi:hypothetical protein